jgi:hypothetical protein
MSDLVEIRWVTSEMKHVDGKTDRLSPLYVYVTLCMHHLCKERVQLFHFRRMRDGNASKYAWPLLIRRHSHCT